MEQYTNSIDKEIEAILGYSLSPKLKGTITNLNDVSLEMVEDARKLSYPQKIHFLNHYLSSDLFRFIGEFIEDVFEKGESSKSWRKGRTLIPDFPLQELLTLNIPQILAPLQPKPAENWMRMRVNTENWEENDFTAGAPAVYRAEPDYLWTPPEHVTDFVPLDSKYVEPVVDIEIACRRWIALNIALHLYDSDMLYKIYDKQIILKSISTEQINLSRDASIAFNSLIMELEDFRGKTQGAPGFMGADALYSS